MHHAFRAAMVLIGMTIVYKLEIVHHLRNPAQLYHLPYVVGTGALLIATAILLFLIIWRNVIQRGMDYRRWRTHSPRSIKMLILTSTISVVSLSIAFKPVFGWIASSSIFMAVAYSSMCILAYI